MKKLIHTALCAGVISVLLVGCGQGNIKNTEVKQVAVQDKETSGTPSQTLTNHPAQSSNPNHNAELAKIIQDNFNKSGVDVHVTSVVATDVPDMYWLSLDKTSPMFVDKTGQYLFQGDVIKIGGDKPDNIGAKMQSLEAKSTLAQVDKNSMIIFPAKTEAKSHIYVFTDPTCHYCQKLHGEIDDINAQGVEVRYLAWPRGDQMRPLAQAVWCSADRNDALTRAKQGERIEAPECENPIKEHMALGHGLGVTGTPAVFAQNGMQIGGYLPADELVKMALANKE